MTPDHPAIRTTAERLARIHVFGSPLVPVPPITVAHREPQRDAGKPWSLIAKRVMAAQIEELKK